MPPNKPTILAVGLNPAHQRTLVVDRLQVGEVNRANREFVSPGGKAIHFALAANRVAPKSTTAAFFHGGATGDYVVNRMAQLGQEVITVETPDDTRTCITVLDPTSDTVTELISPSATVPEPCVDAMRNQLLAASGSFDALAFCGTYPPGISEPFLLDAANAFSDKIILLDGYKGVNLLLKSGLVSILKINVDELKALTGHTDPIACRNAVFDRYDVDGLLVTDGGNLAFAFNSKGSWKLMIPTICVVNPIGAGDTCSAVTLLELLRGQPLVDSFAMGLAAASASCLTYEGGRFDPAVMSDLRARMTVASF